MKCIIIEIGMFFIIVISTIIHILVLEKFGGHDAPFAIWLITMISSISNTIGVVYTGLDLIEEDDDD